MKLTEKNVKILISILIFIGIFLFFFIKSNFSKEEKVVEENTESIFPEEEKIPEKEEPKELKKIFVDIKGAIVTPGVYEVEEKIKIIDVVNLAGGFTENANTSMINLAKQVTNEMVIIIYTNEEVAKVEEKNSISKIVDNKCICPEVKNDGCLTIPSSEQTDDKNQETNSLKEKININTATLIELETIPGIGTSKAEAILKYREENGNFKDIESIKEVSGIGDALFAKIKDYITV